MSNRAGRRPKEIPDAPRPTSRKSADGTLTEPKTLQWFKDNVESCPIGDTVPVKLLYMCEGNNTVQSAVLECTVTKVQLELKMWKSREDNVDPGKTFNLYCDEQEPWILTLHGVRATNCDAKFAYITKEQLNFNYGKTKLFVDGK